MCGACLSQLLSRYIVPFPAYLSQLPSRYIVPPLSAYLNANTVFRLGSFPFVLDLLRIARALLFVGVGFP